jgi:hypothetical protein
VEKRAELYFGAVIRRLHGALTGQFSVSDLMIRVASWSYSEADSVALAEYLERRGAFKGAFNVSPGEWQLLAEGHILYEKMAGRRGTSSQGFVAMWFDPALKVAYEDGFAAAIRGAGYDPQRVDMSEHADKIDDRIIAEIRRSAFVVADFTGHRGGVYYEAGFAHGLGCPVIFTCKTCDCDKLHFDVRQYNTIRWNVPTEIVRPLQNRILAMFGAGPLRPNAQPIP